jgi:hypothetical protein
MEKVAKSGTQAGPGWEAALGRCSAVALAACAVCPALQAQDAGETPAQVLMAEARSDPSQMRMQVRASALPRLEAQDSGFQAPRIDLSLTPAQGGFGAVVGMSGFSAGLQPIGLQPQRTSIDLGLRWSQRQIDIMAWRRMNTPDDADSLAQLREPVYGARVEMKLAPARKRGFALDRGFIGFQLESGARISVKRKDGRPMIYYRSSF